MWHSGNPSSHLGSLETTPTSASSDPRSLQANTDGTDTGEAQRIMVPDAPRDSEEPRESETEDECLPPHFVDIFAGRNRPMSRAMEWCGWTTSSFEKFPADCSCSWAECRCGKSKDVRLESVQTEAFSEMRRAQATWIALDCHTLTKPTFLHVGSSITTKLHTHPCGRQKICGAKRGWNPAAVAPIGGLHRCRRKSEASYWNRMN